jgi:hypothetical protein
MFEFLIFNIPQVAKFIRFPTFFKAPTQILLIGKLAFEEFDYFNIFSKNQTLDLHFKRGEVISTMPQIVPLK